MFHVIIPDSDGWVSVDYADTLEAVLTQARYEYRRQVRSGSFRPVVALANGRQGAPLQWVMYSARKAERAQALSVHATALGANRAYLKFGRSREADAVQEYGFMPLGEWLI